MQKMLNDFKYGKRKSYKYKNFIISVGGYDLYFSIYNNNEVMFENIGNDLICYDRAYIKYIPVILNTFSYITNVKINE